jgi:hypothetical protein
VDALATDPSPLPHLPHSAQPADVPTEGEAMNDYREYPRSGFATDAQRARTLANQEPMPAVGWDMMRDAIKASGLVEERRKEREARGER